MQGDFTFIPTGNFTEPIQTGYLKCTVCGERVETGIMNVAKHWSECFGKDFFSALMDFTEHRKEIMSNQMLLAIEQAINFQFPDIKNLDIGYEGTDITINFTGDGIHTKEMVSEFLNNLKNDTSWQKK